MRNLISGFFLQSPDPRSLDFFVPPSYFSLLRRTRSCPPGDTMGDTNLRPREDKINVSEPADSLT